MNRHDPTPSLEDRLYFRQWLAGRDFAVGDPIAGQMANFVYAIGDQGTGEVVLVDPQFYPRSTTVPHYERYVSTMHSIAEQHRIPVFRRYAIMKYLIASGQHTVDKFLWRDKFHLNDLSYGCLAELMAAAMKERLQRRDAATGATMQRASAVPTISDFDQPSSAF